jgi:hypothetical protein
MSKIITLLVGVLLLALPQGVTAQATEEEQTVRKTYAKLVFGTMIGLVHALLGEKGDPSAAEIENAIAYHRLSFEFSDFSVGPVGEIAKRPYADLVTPPDSQDVVDVTPSTYTNTEDLREQLQIRQTEELGARVSWAKGHEVNTENWQVPFGEALPLINSQNHSTYSRYISYKVTASLDGRARSYKAMFLFGTGQVPVLVADNVTDSPALGQFVPASVYPAILLDSGIAQKTGITDWLTLHRLSEAACPSGRREVCCDPATLTCGVSSADVDAALRKTTSL